MTWPGPEAPAEVELDLTQIAHGGEAIGRLDDGRVVFTGGGLPGEHAKVRLRESHERYARGVLAELPAAPSAERILAPPCPYFGTWPERGLQSQAFCGGCQWQHVAYEAQLRLKAEVLHDALSRLAGLTDPPVAPTVGMGEPWHYRNQLRMRPAVEGLGFVALDGATITPVSTCLIAHPLVFELAGLLADELPPNSEVLLRAGIRTGDRLVVLKLEDVEVDEIAVEADVSVTLVRPDGRQEVAAGRPYLVESLLDRSFLIPPTAFFQVNTEMAETLVRLVGEALPEHVGTLVDVYSGVGTFAAFFADRADELFAIESDSAAVAAAIDNTAGFDHVTLVEADAHEGLAELGLRPDVAIVDPPRAGLDRATVTLLAEQVRDTIIYVSCDPATLARDTRQLVAAGWSLAASRPVDMFPQTWHVESVNVLRR